MYTVACILLEFNSSCNSISSSKRRNSFWKTSTSLMVQGWEIVSQNTCSIFGPIFVPIVVYMFSFTVVRNSGLTASIVYSYIDL